MKNLGTKNTAEDLASVGLGIQNAEVGQVVTVGSVDADGQPIGYESKELYPTDPREFDSSPIFTGDQVGVDGTPLPNVLNALDDAKVDKTRVAETFIEQIQPSSANVTFATEEELAEKVDKTKVAETFIEQIQPSSESMAFASQGYVDSKLAPVETSPATAAHTTGSLLLYSGTLYRATADIAVGATLTVGTNIAATDLDEVVSLLKSAINAKPDIDLGITGASVGDLIKVSAVDASGRPAAWTQADKGIDYIAPISNRFRWRKIVDYVTTVETLNSSIPSIAFTEDLDGNSISATTLLVFLYGQIINETDNDSHLRLGFGQTNPTSFNIYCLPKTSPFSVVLIANNNDGVITCLGPPANNGGNYKSVQDPALNSDPTISRIALGGNNYNKTHLAAGAKILVYTLEGENV